MGRQWFGDFVTPAFWGHLWLAEGPATYFEAVGGEHAFPGSAFLDRFYADSVTRFLDHDGGGEVSHPLATTAGAAHSLSCQVLDHISVVLSQVCLAHFPPSNKIRLMPSSVWKRHKQALGCTCLLQRMKPAQNRPLGHQTTEPAVGRVTRSDNEMMFLLSAALSWLR